MQGFPDLGSDLVFLKEFECFFVFAPEGEEFDPAFFVLEDFLLELGNVLGSPVVGRPFQSELNQHFGSFFGIALTCVERNDAPGHEFFRTQVLGDYLRPVFFGAQLTK